MAFDDLDRAYKFCKTKKDKVEARVVQIRLLTMAQKTDWFKQAQHSYDKAFSLMPEHAGLHYFMGIAFKEAGYLDRAADQFKEVLRLDKGYGIQANKEWERVQEIKRAEPGTQVIREVAHLKVLNRAQVAALFIEELQLEKLYQERGVEKDEAPIPYPNDFMNHPLRADIEKLIRLRVRGLGLTAVNTFEPEKPITRARFALMLEDILVRLTGDKGLPVRFLSCNSPFKDVHEGHYAFNAIVAVAIRGLMETDLSGNFRKNDPISGAEALLVIRRLKEKL